jgi:hypothetical protein
MAQLQATGVTGSLVTTGNVGIGLTNPQSPLHVIAANQNNNALIQEWSYTNASIDQYSLMLKQTVTSGVVRYNFSMVNNNTAYDNVLVLDRGNVGIGITNPGVKLQVVGGIRTNTFSWGDTDNVPLGSLSYGSDFVTMETNAAYPIRLITNGTAALTIDTSQRVGIGITNPTGKLTILAEVSNTPSLLFKNELGGPGSAISNYVSSAQTYTVIGTNLFVNNLATLNRFDAARASCGIAFDEGNLIIATGGTGGVASARLVVKDNGNVGIGTNTPTLNTSGRVLHIAAPSNEASIIHFTNATTGNSATDGLIVGRWSDGVNYIYTYENEDLQFGAGNAVRMTITSGGSVGIGTNNPVNGSKLEVRGSGVWDGGVITLNNTGTGGRVWSIFSTNNSFGQGGGRLLFYNTTAGTNPMVIDSNDQVGIGNTAPSYLLDVSGVTRATAFYAVNDRNQFARGFIRLTSATNNTSTLDISVEDTITSIYSNYYGGGADQPIRIGTYANLTNQLYLATSGNVGIGTTTPAFKLDVSGNAAFGAVGNVIFTKSNGSSYSRFLYSGANENVIYTGGTGGLGINNYADSVRLVQITDAGNVGINTTAPTARLQVIGPADSTYDSTVIIEGSGTYPSTLTGIVLNAPANTQSHLRFSEGGSPKVQFRYNNGSTQDNKLKVYSWALSQDIFTWDIATGNVGIGTVSPTRRLDVREGDVQIVANFQNTNTTSSRIKFTDANTGAENVNIGATGTSLAMWTNNTVRMTILSGGNVGIGTTSPIRDLMIGDLSSVSTATPKTFSLGGTYSSTAGSNVKLRVYEDGSSIGGMSVSGGQMEVNTWSSGKIAFYRGTTLSMVIDTSSNLGINTASPAAKLHVNGTLRVDSSTSFGTEYGAVPNAIIGNKQDEKCLGNPDEWLAINVSGTDYAVPLFSLG